ncbi:MFS monocarboxylate transporter [Penicillium canescens]|nr:MFS monocarboxylate transporter [Penicillium canescens]
MSDTKKALESLEGSETKEVLTKSSFPEGGVKGWLTVLSGWCVMFNTFGYINAFGIYESYYKATFLIDKGESNIAWIGSLQAFFMFSAGLISGPMMDRYEPKNTGHPNSILNAIHHLPLHRILPIHPSARLPRRPPNGLTYTPAVTAINQYFFQKRPIAMGIAYSGSSPAGVIFPIALNSMLNKSTLGFGWSVRVLGFLMLTLSIISCAALSSNASKGKSGAPFLLAAWKHPEYYLQILGLFLMFWGLFDPSFYVPGYAESIGLNVEMPFYLIAILNAGSLFGQLSGGAVANRIGRFNSWTGASSICAILIFCWLTVTSQGGIIAFSVLFGFFSGTVIGLFPANCYHCSDCEQVE